MACDVKQSKSVDDARAMESPAGSVDEQSENARLEIRGWQSVAGPVFFPHLAFFRFAAGKAASPVARDVKQSKSVDDARAIESPAGSVDEPSERARLEVRG